MMGESDAEFVGRVITTLAHIVRDPDVLLEPDTPLERVRGFDSHVLYRLIADLETVFGVELKPEFIVPETFATPATVAAAFARQQSVA